MQSEKQIISQLKKDLWGKGSTAALAIGVSATTVCRILNGTHDNAEILDKLIDYRNSLIVKKKKEIQKLHNKMQQAK